MSGGLDSAVLLAEEAGTGDVQPIHVAVGLAWERAEHAAIEGFLAGAGLGAGVRSLVSLTSDMTGVYRPAHWAIQGRPPSYHTPDEDVYLPGRNVVLLAAAGVYCGSTGIARLVLGTLGHNPFPDATPVFRAAMASALSLGLDHALKIDAPYARVSKSEVIRRGVALGVPLALTLSCMNPAETHVSFPTGPHEGKVVPPLFPRHCGVCSKCRERHDAFGEAGVDDPTCYRDRRYIAR